MQVSSLIPRTVFFNNPMYVSPQISPDSRYLSYLAPDENNILQIWLRTIGEEDDRQLTNEKKRGIFDYFWTYNSEKLIYSQDSDGDENFHLYLVDIKTNLVRDLTPFEGVNSYVIDLNHKFPDEILVGLNLNKREKFDAYRINLNNGAVEFDTDNPGSIWYWIATNNDFKILAAISTTPDGGSDVLFRKTVDQPWSTLRHWEPTEEGWLVNFSLDDETLYLIDSHNSNALRLVAIDIETRAETVIAKDEQYDVENILVHPTQRHIQAVSFYKDKLQWQALNESVNGDLELIAETRSGEYHIVSRDLADKNWIIAYQTDDGPIYYYLHNRDSKSSTLLFSHRPELESVSLASMKSISYQARDGLTIHGYLTLPPGLKSPLPTVLFVHGGPWARDVWGYHSAVQWLANRGYAVLQVNFRGSTGYGKAFLNAGNREWGAKMHDDLIDGVNWLVERGIAERDKIAIMGASYGGYATLAGLTFTPEVFACGVDQVGPSNLLTMMNSFPSYWASGLAIWKYRVGDVETEEEFLKSRSPLFFVDRIEKPLLIEQGANDVRVNKAESDQMVEAMRKAGKSVKYVLYDDEGHINDRPENRLHFYAVAEEFLAKHLGGRFEPMGEIKGHSGVIM
jgi:dipeptidyl aminopeptidase/acylaminoacyl peptidase